LPAGAPVIAVTGSSGKTSTKEMLRAALGSRWRACHQRQLNNLIGVPLTILSAPADTEALVIEQGRACRAKWPSCAISSNRPSAW